MSVCLHAFLFVHLCTRLYVCEQKHSPLSSRFFFHPLSPPFLLLYTVTNLISCALSSLILPPHNDSGPHGTFHFLSHTIKPCRIVWQVLTNHRDKQGLQMFFLHGILHPAGLLVIIFFCVCIGDVCVQKHFSASSVRGFSWIISFLECLLMGFFHLWYL